jgi:capsule polysaccharide export protein KpsE/RkpR
LRRLFYFNELDKYNREERFTKGKAKREFLEKRVQQVTADINNTSEEMAAFQQKNNIVNLDEQVTAALDTYGTMLKEKMEAATELEFAISYYAKDNPKVNELQKKLAAINTQIDKLQTASVTKYIPNFDNVNALGVQFMKRKMNLEILAEVYKNLIPQLEMAKLEELNDLTSIQYIQRPTLDGLREKPKRAMLCIIAFFSAFLFASFASLIYDLVASQKDRFKEILKDC